MLSTAVANAPAECSSIETAIVNPPAGQTCGQYFQNYISLAGGSLANPNDTSNCSFCQVTETNTFLAGVSSSGEKRLYASLSEDDKAELEARVAGYEAEVDKEKDVEGAGVSEGKKDIKYVPVWVDDKVAHGHYDEYCKTS